MSSEPPPYKREEPPAGLPQLFVYPGQVVASATPSLFITILGTCASVCLYDPVVAVGGLNHYLLPYGAATLVGGARYGNVAVEQLLREVLAQGAHKRRLRAKVFGGMTARQPASPYRDLGASNVAFALEWLAEQAIPVEAKDTGGPGGRKLLFHSGSGTAWVRRL
jgi:chemotaxis protein CheD